MGRYTRTLYLKRRLTKFSFLLLALLFLGLSAPGQSLADVITLSLYDFVIFSGGGGNAPDGGYETTIGGHTYIIGNIGSNQDVRVVGNPLPGYPAQLDGSAYAGGNLFFGQDETVNGSAVVNGDATISGGVSISGTLDAATATIAPTAVITGGTTIGAGADTFALIPLTTWPSTTFTTLGTTDTRNNATFALSPNTYGTLALQGDNNITLSSGNYYFAAITTSAGSNNKLYLDLTSGDPINIYVEGVLDFDTQDNMLYVKGPGMTEYKLISDPTVQHLAGLIYWETHDQFLLGGSGVWGGTVNSTLANGDGIVINQFINYTGAVYAYDSISINDHGTWTYVSTQAAKVPEPITLILYGFGFAGAGLYRHLRRKRSVSGLHS